MKLYDPNEAPEPYIGPAVSRPVTLATMSIRSELEYLADPERDTRSLEVIRQMLGCVSGRPFLFLTSPAPMPRSRVRTKKGLLWNYPNMQHLEAVHREVAYDETRTMLTSLICLDHYDFDCTTTALTSRERSVLIVSDLEIDRLFSIAIDWLKTPFKGIVTLDMERIFIELERIPTTAVLRYFPAYNRHDEIVAVVGHENIVDEAAIERIARLSPR